MNSRDKIYLRGCEILNNIPYACNQVVLDVEAINEAKLNTRGNTLKLICLTWST